MPIDATLDINAAMDAAASAFTGSVPFFNFSTIDREAVVKSLLDHFLASFPGANVMVIHPQHVVNLEGQQAKHHFLELLALTYTYLILVSLPI